eukprot:TRINITY_DN9724_c0_g1_i3.p1 TRINITY_DN9724_c0_g1~~TRINITY_DN9724_c0_g1_i3.p1  ORF type:complete len:211 (-),score=15.10 TRINITY_DN9724_c0_g1_i3:303-935(-)
MCIRDRSTQSTWDVIKGQQNSLIGGNIDLDGTTAGLQNLGGLAAGQEYDRRNWFVGATVPFGKAKFLVSYGQVKDKTLSEADASKWAVGARYALSKRTELYADYAQIKNDRNASFTINPMGNSAGLSGTGVNGFAMGIKHAFQVCWTNCEGSLWMRSRPELTLASDVNLASVGGALRGAPFFCLRSESLGCAAAVGLGNWRCCNLLSCRQ